MAHCRDDAAVCKLHAKGNKTAEGTTPQEQRSEVWLSEEHTRVLTFAECDAKRVTTKKGIATKITTAQTIAGIDKTCWNCVRSLLWTRCNLQGVCSRTSTPLSTKFITPGPNRGGKPLRSATSNTATRGRHASTKPRRPVKKHALGSMKQLSSVQRP